jgi:hypothetical protein
VVVESCVICGVIGCDNISDVRKSGFLDRTLFPGSEVINNVDRCLHSIDAVVHSIVVVV